MPYRITGDDTRAAKLLNQGSVDGARAVCAIPLEMGHRRRKRIDNFNALVDAAATYREISVNVEGAAQSVHETPDEAYMSATFAGMHEAVTRKCGVMPEGCWRCERDTSRPFAGSIWIRHEGDKHYIAFTDTCGNTTEEQIYSCPWCRKKF